MKKLLFSLFVIALIFSFNIKAFADEGHSHDSNMEMDMDMDMDQNMDHFKSGEHSEHKENTDVHGDHHEPVKETPPNYKVLGTYGAVNLSFILIGVWNKWIRRKGI
ncbi:hypothetical protein ACE38V_22195 [Cytobacillus sp. Hz8]|uniref:hypothetical protein n=1 Tax=Cytobacillus sp. Hz8 TaxID=3347168 RepID=UPI0035DA372C